MTGKFDQASFSIILKRSHFLNSWRPYAYNARRAALYYVPIFHYLGDVIVESVGHKPYIVLKCDIGANNLITFVCSAALEAYFKSEECSNATILHDFWVLAP